MTTSGFALDIPVALAAALLFYTGVTKLVRPAPLKETIGQLGFPAIVVGWTAALLALAEIALGTSITMVRGAFAAAALVAFGLLFASVGVYAVATGRITSCNCFRSAQSTVLGWRQVLNLPLWIGAAWLMLSPVVESAPLNQRLATTSGSLLIAFVSTFAHYAPSFFKARTARLELMSRL